MRPLHLLSAAWLAFGTSQMSFAQDFPTKPLRLIVPFAAGGASDVLARILAPRLADRLGQQVIVDNRAGAGGSIGAGAAVRSAPDGYTLLLGSTSEIAINPWLYEKLGYDTRKDLTAVAMVASSQIVVVVHPSLPARTAKELIALARSRPGEVNFGSAGIGSFTHLTGELFRTATNVSLTHVPFKGAVASMTGAVTGEVQVILSTLTTGMPFINSKRLRPIAVSTKARAPSLPAVPTLIESGVQGFDVEYFWAGVFVPAATPRNLVARLTAEIAHSLKLPDVMESIATQNATPGNLTQAQFAEFVNAEHAMWGKAVRSSGAKAE